MEPQKAWQSRLVGGLIGGFVVLAGGGFSGVPWMQVNTNVPNGGFWFVKAVNNGNDGSTIHAFVICASTG
jgi:hypothetical protein